MARKVEAEQYDSFDASKKRVGKRKRKFPIIWLVAVTLAVLIVLLPRIIANRSFVLAAIDRFAGLKPLQVDFASVQAGWFAPLTLSGLQVADEHGQILAKVGHVETQKGLWSWITASSQLKTIRLKGLEVLVESSSGSTNIERAIAHLTVAPAPGESTHASKTKGFFPKGSIELADANIRFKTSANPEEWLVAIPKLKVALSSSTEMVGPLQFEATVSPVVSSTALGGGLMKSQPTALAAGSGIEAGTASAPEASAFGLPEASAFGLPEASAFGLPEASAFGLPEASAFGSRGTTNSSVQSSGAIAAELTHADFGGTNGLAFRAAANSIPLGFWQVLKDRLPDIPIQALDGSLSAQIAGSFLDSDHWSLDIQKLDGQRLRMHATNWTGMQPAKLDKVSFAGRCTLTNGKMSLDKSDIQCDFGTLSTSATFPWPVQMPTLAQPWLPASTFDASGSIDLARFVKATESLIPMREDTKLVSGSAQFRMHQKLDNGEPTSQLELELGSLVAVASGRTMKWDHPLKVAASAGSDRDGKVRFASQIEADFCDLNAAGNLEKGNVSGRIDLDRLQQRVAELVALPIKTMAGSAKIGVDWVQSEPGKLQANGQLETTPLQIDLASGGKMREPAWNGVLKLLARLDGSQVTQIDSGRLALKSEHESLQIELLEPVSLKSAESRLGSLAPAAFTLSARGDLANWQRRAAAFSINIPDTQIAGKFELASSGRIDAQHAELLEATLKSEPFEVSMSQMRLAEPQLMGVFKGRVNSTDFTQTAVDKLELRATAFSLGAADEPASDGSGARLGRAAFLVDIGRLMSSVQTGTAASPVVLPPGINPPSNPQMAFAGRMQGEFGWKITSLAAAFSMKANGENLEVLSQAKVANAGGEQQRLWMEPSLATQLSGNWLASNNSVKLDQLQIQAPWINFAGSLLYDTNAQQQSVRLTGQCAYDAAQVGDRIKPWTGSHVQLVGQKTVPVDVSWTSKTGASGSLLAGLQASTRIGWDQAQVVGIQVGKADVPVSVTNGKLATAAEIPVSGGILRWDIDGNLASEKIMLVQKPMTVLENVAITPEMCESWLKYVAPLLAEATAVEGRLSLKLNDAKLDPVNPRSQLVDGTVLMHNAEIGPGPLTNQVITLVQQVNAIRKQDLAQAVSSQRPWVKMPEQAINFRMENGQVVHRNLNIRAGDVTISTSGTVDIDGRLELLADMPIPNDWAEKSPWLAALRGRSLQFPVRGTLSGPQVDTQLLRQLGRDTVQQAAQGFLQKELSRGIGKLLGTPPPPQGPAGQ